MALMMTVLLSAKCWMQLPMQSLLMCSSRLERQGKLAPHVQSLVQTHNADLAKTAMQVIDPGQR